MKFDEEPHRTIGCDVVKHLGQHDACVVRVERQFTAIEPIDNVAKPPRQHMNHPPALELVCVPVQRWS